MWATVTVSFLGSPPHLWNDVLGEGSSSLNHLLSCWLVHQSYSTSDGGSSMVTCLYFLSLVFQVVQSQLEDSLVDVLWWCLHDVCGLDLLLSLEKLLHEDLLCGVSHW